MRKRVLVMFMFAIAMACLTTPTLLAADTVLDYAVKPKPGVWKSGEFRIWIPENVKTLRGLLINFHGFSGDARTVVTKKPWQEAARQWGFALVGLKFWNGSNVDYRYPEKGSGGALLEALKDFAERSVHPEIERLPVCLWGMSLGGASAHAFANWMPRRVIAFAAVNGTWKAEGNDPDLLQVPALFFMGELDTVVKPEGVVKVFETNRRQWALWALVQHWGIAHDNANADALIIPFFDQVIRLRLPENAEEKVVHMRDLAQFSGWLGSRADWDTPCATIAPFTSFKGDKREACWLPNETVAWLWRGSVSRNPGFKVNAAVTTGTAEHKTVTLGVIPAADGLSLPGDLKAVRYYDGSQLLGEAAQAPWQFVTDKLARGVHGVLAVADERDGKAASSNPLVVEDGVPYPWKPKPKKK